jgi:CRISPR/Cas system-associated protein endoribonuclease Cas2
MIEHELTGLPDFDYLISEFSNPQPIIRAIAAYDRAKFVYNINNGLDPYDVPYTPLEIRYAQSKRRAVGDKPILVRTGKMVKSYRQTFTKDGYSVRIDSSYAKYHQSAESRTHLPRRMLLPDSGSGLPPKYQAKLIELTFKQYESVLYKNRTRS